MTRPKSTFSKRGRLTILSEMLTLSAQLDDAIYYLYVRQHRFYHARGSLILWAPLPIDHAALPTIVTASKTVASWLKRS